ncbi:serine/threonine protein kinase [Oscillatoria sp. FACHB-1407]|uniref:serine/threonine protein kinase n=1 Tax=Oscillatoria sp. FACHB-1407 TaxID=2692847 RepID=UPI0016879B8B|nr:protein kinase [Oscillatoria sp. FACHB-1407]MBD2465979.1 serine/threonine protein kinase [Oscillatoria sp. FACHB-1407]
MFTANQILQQRYELQQQLGITRRGRQTWLARDFVTQPNRPVIIKLLIFNAELQWDDLKLFEREAQVLKSLNHPKVPKYQDYFKVDQPNHSDSLWWGLVQDYIPGTTLKEALEQGYKFNEEELHRIAREILQILIHLHELSPPVLHRDIKPSNLILDQDKQIHLIDFGAVQSNVALPGTTFTVVGTVGYTPLEQFGGKAVPASDLYALGATLIHLLTGVAPAELPQKDLQICFRDGISINSDFIKWIEKMTQPSIEKRFRSARQALASLNTKQDSDSKKVNFVNSIQTLQPRNSTKLSRPSVNQVVLKKTSARLEIHPIKPSQSNYPLFMLLGAGLIAVLIMFTLQWVLVSSSFIASLFAFSIFAYFTLLRFALPIIVSNFPNRTHLYFDLQRNRFEIRKDTSFGGNSKPTKLEVWDSISAIKYVMATQRTGSGGERKWAVTIRTSRSYLLDWNLTEVECMWIIQEIQDWLTSG